MWRSPSEPRRLVRSVLRRFVDTRDLDTTFVRAEVINRDALDTLHARRLTSSFFLFLNYMDAHEPYNPPAPFNRKFGSAPIGWTQEDYGDLKEEVLTKNRSVPPETSRHLTAMYDGAIAYEDAQIGQLFEQLEKDGLFDDSLIIVTSDHGEGLTGVHGFGHPGSVYQDHIGIPLVIKNPHQREAHVVQDPVSQIDLMPTVLSTVGIPMTSKLAGIDLRATDQPTSRELLSASYPCLSVHYPALNRTVLALISKNMKYIQSTAGSRELYNLELDPGERSNLFTDNSPEAAVRITSLTAMLKMIPQFHSKTEPDALRPLRGLGYVQ